MVPTACNLISGVQEVFPDSLEWRAVKGVQDLGAFYSAGLSYLYVEQPVGEVYVVTHSNFQSQLFRRVIAASTGRPERYDWRTYQEEQHVESTVRTVEKWLSRNGTYLMPLGRRHYE
ncbi:unnamed protein product [marine sediment metagenome]|uniref:Uncharacterized protein n=1 Tax=marine sediment metagenome TaxID=412755 RepID=X1C654_9ZZZZ